MSHKPTAMVAVITVVGVLSAVSAAAQARYDLRPRFAVGQRWAEERANTFEMTTTVTAGGQVMERNQQRSREVLEIEWEVLAIDDGVPTAARVKFGANCGMEMSQNGQSQTQKFPVAGATVTARLLPNGDVEYDPATADVQEVEAVFEDLFEINAGAYPKQPIAVGDSWDWDKAAIIDAFGIGPDDEGAVKCTLRAVNTEEGREVGDIDFQITLKRGEAQQGGGQRLATLTESTVAGAGRIDITGGRLIELNLSGKLVTSGIIYADDGAGNMAPQADIDGIGEIKLESRARLVSGSAPAGPSSPPADADYSGEYTNPEITLSLTEAADGYTGTLRLGEREFPVRAKHAASGLAGQFQSDDHWFDFTATLAGAKLTLSTGGKTHTLQKQTPAPVNPLGGAAPANPRAKDQPANPLGGGGEAPTPAPPVAHHQPQQPHSARGYEVFRCLDEHGFRDRNGQPLEVFRMLLPRGWRFNGGVTWKVNHQDVTTLSRVDLVNPAELHFQIASPNDRVVIQAYPEVHFADLRGSPAYDMGLFPPGSNYGGFVVSDVMDPASYITQFVIPQQRGSLQNAQIIETKEIPSLVRRYDREAAIVNGALQGLGGGVSHQAALVTVEHTIGGVPYHEAFVVVLGYLQTSGITMWSSKLNLSMRAPRDEVEQWRPVVAGILTSIEFNMRWIGEYLRLQQRAGGVIIDVDRFCQQVDAEITRNRAKTNAQIHRDMYPRLAPFCDHSGPDGKRYFLETDLQHQMDEHGHIRSDISLPDTPGWTNMPEYTGP